MCLHVGHLSVLSLQCCVDSAQPRTSETNFMHVLHRTGQMTLDEGMHIKGLYGTG